MLSLLLKKALPFALTFVVGTALGGLAGLFGGSGKKPETALVTRTYNFHRKCDGGARRQHLVAESMPLAILSKPDAWLPRGAVSWKDGEPSALVRVTFGADGKIQDVTPVTKSFRTPDDSLVEVKAYWDAVEQAARRIRFTPETVDGLPVTVTRDVEIRLYAD